MSSNNVVDILLVDDRADGLLSLEALLSEIPNYNLIKAQSGREAIGTLELYDFAVILLDVQMPDLDGFETAEIIRRQVKFKNIPIIFVTAINKDDRYVFRGYELGAVDYIFKPLDPMMLRSKVAVFAALHLSHRKIREQSRLLAERDALQNRAYIQALELENLRRYRSLADAIPHIILRASPSGTLEYNNNLWSSYTGMSNAESIGMGWQKAIHPGDINQVVQEWNTAMATAQLYEAECRLRRRDGVFRWHWIKAEPELDHNGVLTAWLGTCTDIHDRKIAQERLMKAQREAELANDAKTHFLANMSHEIRTPLNAIMGFTELLLDPNISAPEKIKCISIVRRNGHQLLKIVDEILDISKVEAGGLEIEKVEMQTLEVLHEIKTLMLVEATKRKIDLIFRFPGSLPKTIVTDSTRLRQILINMIGNAIKFTDRGSVTLTTTIHSEDSGPHCLHFEIVDTGLGIDRENAKKIFLPFSQADTSTTRLYGGTGLGLALSRRFARALGGDVRLKHSKRNVGSTFVVEVKVEVPENCAWVTSSIESTEPEQEIARRASTMTPLLSGKRILLVEDAEDNQFLIKQFLSRTGAELDFACNGQEGIDKAMSGDYQVVLMDIQMPLVDGYEATTRLRKMGYDRPIIALTAHALVGDREKCIETGCNSHLTKPINRQKLIDSLVEFTGPDRSL